MKECVVVVGMHRSGTSVLSGLVSVQGFYLGTDIMPTREDNPKGFFENMKVYKLNQSILEAYNTSWDDYFFTVDQIKPNELHEYIAEAKAILNDEFGAAKRVFIKDPRMCLLFPLWEKALLDLGYTIKVILAYRSPMEVAHSLKTRNQMVLEKSLLVWSHYFFQAEISTRQYQRMLVHYSYDFQDLSKFVRKLGVFLNVEITDAILESSQQLYTPRLNHYNHLGDNHINDYPSYLTDFLKFLSVGKLTQLNEFDRIYSEFYNSKNLFLYNEDNLNQRIFSLEETLVNIEREFQSTLFEKEATIIEQESIIKNQEVNLKKLKSKKLNLEEKLLISNQLFNAARDNNKFTKKLRSTFKAYNYYKIKKSILIFSSAREKLLLEEKEIIVRSGLFSPFYYLTHNIDVWKAGLDPLNHFCRYGWKEGRNPSQYFNCKLYLNSNKDVALEGRNPLVHYLKYGKSEGRVSGVNLTSELDKQKDALFPKKSEFNIQGGGNKATSLKRQEIGLFFFKKISKYFLSDKLTIKLTNDPAGFFKDSRNELVRIYASFFKLTDLHSYPRIEKSHSEYDYIEPKINEKSRQKIFDFESKPLISIIMPVYNVEIEWVEKAIHSIESQWYENWELNIVDDASKNKRLITFLESITNPKIHVEFLSKNSNISRASNKALGMASGQFIALMDHDDELTPNALYEVIKVINETGAEFIYSDEDKLDMNGKFCEPHYKPDYSPDMLLSQNYISHLCVIKKDLVDAVGGWSVGFEGAQDYDLYLKVLETTDKIQHIPKILYHWRMVPGSTAAVFSDKSYAQDAGRRALDQALKRRGVLAITENGKFPGTYRVKYDILDDPLVSIIIPFKDKADLLKMCIDSILQKSSYLNYEIIGVSNNSEEVETFEAMLELESKDNRIKFYEYNDLFNYSKINNYAVKNYVKGTHIILLNNDIEIISSDWIQSMLEFSQRSDVGAVGCKLLYPNSTIQHAGVIVGIGGVAGHSHKHFNMFDHGYFSRLSISQNLSAVTAACLMVKKSIYDEFNGLNENDLKIAFNDVDFCLRIREEGYLNVYTPFAQAYHHESISRGAEDTIEKKERFKKEVEYMKKRHNHLLSKGDPYYNTNLTLDFENFSLKPKELN